MQPISYEQTLAAVRTEVRRYVDDDISDDQPMSELRIISDDQTAIAMALERRFKVKLPQSTYDHVATAADLARAFHDKLQAGGR